MILIAPTGAIPLLVQLLYYSSLSVKAFEVAPRQYPDTDIPIVRQRFGAGTVRRESGFFFFRIQEITGGSFYDSNTFDNTPLRVVRISRMMPIRTFRKIVAALFVIN